ncbi:PorV/PorQ family protein [Gracilimonas sp.]|uniref:PorV/PorQ family protein n=1 Tax=Gracilimonas sp. TaxID=1974203 RepID=UPI0032EFA1F8
MKVILSVFLMLAGSTSIIAQLNITAFPLPTQNFDVKSLSLGTATVSLSDGYGSIFVNPAGIGEDEVLKLSPDFNAFQHPYALDYKSYQLSGTYDVNKSTIGISIQGFRVGGQLVTTYYYENMNYKFRNTELITKFAYARQFENNLKIGAALNYLYSGEAIGTMVSAQKVEPVYAWSMDLGLQHEFSMKYDFGTIKPSSGLALTNFGKGVNYFKGVDYYNSERSSSLPTRLQAGVGFTFISLQKKNGYNFVELRVMQNASKLLVRRESRVNESGTYYVAMNPFKALASSWGSYNYYDGINNKVIEPEQQIWMHSGAEVKFMETVAIRWGLRKAGGFEADMSYQSLGFGLDLFYVVLDYAIVFDNPEYGNFLEGTQWQISGRIPLDGYRPDNILHRLLN